MFVGIENNKIKTQKLQFGTLLGFYFGQQTEFMQLVDNFLIHIQQSDALKKLSTIVALILSEQTHAGEGYSDHLEKRKSEFIAQLRESPTISPLRSFLMTQDPENRESFQAQFCKLLKEIELDQDECVGFDTALFGD